MLNNNERTFFFKLGLLSVALFFALSFFKADGLLLSYFSIGFIWPMAVSSPGVGAYVARRQYRLSFLKAIYWLDQKLGAKPLLRALPCWGFVLCLAWSLNLDLILILTYAVVGSLYFEGVEFWLNRKSKNS